MRQVLNTTVIRRYTYPLLLSLIVILLVLFGSSQNEESKIKSEETQKNEVATGLLNTNENTTEVSNPDSATSNGTDENDSSSTRFSLSIKASSNTTDESSSNSVTVNTQINGQEFGNIFDECLEKGEVEIDEDGTEVECEFENGSLKVNFESDSNTSSKNKVNSDSNVSVEQKSH